jgi:subfamily B ATP-binding cassette protein MsbA
MSEMTADLKAVLDIIKSREKAQPFKLSRLIRLWPYLRSHRGKLVMTGLMIMLMSMIGLPGPYLIKYIIDDVLPSGSLYQFLTVILVLIILAIAKVGVSFFHDYFLTCLNQEVLVSVKRDLFQRLLKLPLTFFDQSQTGYLVSRLREVDGLGFLFSSSIIRLLTAGIETIFTLLVMLYLEWRLTLISLIVVPLLYATARFYSKGLRIATADLLERTSTISKDFQEALSGISVIKAFATEEREIERLHRRMKAFARSGIRQSIISSMSGEVLSLITTMGTILVLLFSGIAIMQGHLTIGLYVAFTGYISRLYGPIRMFASIGLLAQPALAALRRVFDLLDLTAEHEDEERTVPVPRIRGDIVFENVSFSYDGQRKALDNISFEIKPGETVAFVGPSGAGKSTIIRLLLGLYQADEGKILIDGQDINSLILTDLRERIGVVSQNIFLFSDSIKNNILYSKPEAIEDELIKAAILADAHDFITHMPQGYETLVGERGVRLSGGQLQRISIARAILKDPDVIILDEATSYLDNESERRIQSMLRSSLRNRTCIIIAHRLSTILAVDRIFVLDNGKIVQTGRPEELIHEEGKYRALYGSR